VSPRGLFLAAYFCSGAAALLYQVAWARLLTLHMGQTVAAVGTVLAAFMGGLAGGASLAGRLSRQADRPRALRTYALLEVGIATLALLVPAGLALSRPLLAATYADGTGGLTFALARLATSLWVIALPAAAMGATFPVAVRWYAASADRATADAGRLYAANTAGAALGAAATGFLLLPSLGLAGTTRVGVALNLSAAAGAWWLSLRETATAPCRPGLQPGPRGSSTPAEPERAAVPRAKRSPPVKASGSGRAKPTPSAPGQPWLAGAALAVSGFVALTYEVAWTRILALVLGPTTFAFSAMLVAFIVGIAVGSAAATAALPRVRRPALWLGLVLVATAASAFAISGPVGRLPLAIARTVADPGASLTTVVWWQGMMVTALLLPMSFASGAAFPLATALASRDPGNISTDASIVYALNTLGAIAGSLVASFVLVPRLGLQSTVLAVGLVGTLAGLGVVVTGGLRGWTVVWAGAVAALTAVFGATRPDWDRSLLSSGAYKYAPYVRTADVQSNLEAGTVLYYAEGPAGVVTVRRVAGSVTLAIDGKVDASNSGDMLTQRLLGHLPALLHPNPKEACIIGLGSGVTLGAVLRHPVTRADMVEISPAVVSASAWFDSENHRALADPRARLLVADGRTHLLLSTRRYDLIVSEPSNPWMAGVAALFTAEFFAAARDRLSAHGVFCQWAHTYDISETDLRSIVATFLSVFPDGSMWLVGEGDVLLIGGRTPVSDRLGTLAASWNRPGVAADLAEVNALSAESVLSLFVAAGADLRRYAAGAAIQRDDRRSLEFSAPQGIYGRSAGDNVPRLVELRASAGAPPIVLNARASQSAKERRSRGNMLLKAEGATLAYGEFKAALEIDPFDREALRGLTDAAAAAGTVHEAEAFVRQLTTATPVNVPALVELSRLLAALGRTDEAIAAAIRARDVAPDRSDALEQLASVYADAGADRDLGPIVDRLEQTGSVSAAKYYRATLHFLRGEPGRAAQLAEQVVATDPSDGRAHNLLGAAYASLGLRDRAGLAFAAAARARPDDPSGYVNLGTFELDGGNPGAAERYFAEALTLDPTSVAAITGLANALDQQGETERAARLRQNLDAKTVAR
jgi:spermidine synthase